MSAQYVGSDDLKRFQYRSTSGLFTSRLTLLNMPSHQESGAFTSNAGSPASTVSTNPCSPDSIIQRSGRQRLKPWLEAQINSGKYPGLEWIDVSRRIFRMTWKHGGRADWSEEDGLIFKAWAVHTGRFREGVDEPDWPAWKTRLRCAINKQKPDIQELKEMGCSEEPNPFRVFQFVNRSESGANSPPQEDSSESVSDEPDVFRHAVQNRPSVIQPSGSNIPTTVHETECKPSIERLEAECVDAQVNSLGSDLQHVSIQDLVPPTNISLTNISLDSNINSYTEAMDTDSLKGASGQLGYQPVKLEPLETPDPSYLQTPVGDREMLVTLRFRNEIIHQMKVTNRHGCRVFYGDQPMAGVWDPEVFGSQEADQILVPYTYGQIKSVQQEQYTLMVLKGLELGVNIMMDRGNIYVERRCKTRIITMPANMGDKHTKKVERRERLKVFDFTAGFLPAFRQYQQGEGPRPSPQVIVAIGQDFHTDTEPYTNLFFSVTVSHAEASYLLSQHTAETTAPDLSHSGQFEHHMTVLKEHKATTPIAMMTMNQMAAPEPAYDDNFQM